MTKRIMIMPCGAITRNHHLNRFMANFAEVVRIPPPLKEKVNLHDLLESVQRLMRRECDQRGIQWTWDLAANAPEISVDVQQMEHVLVNILRNAIEAITKAGEITIITHTSPQPKLIIRDNGKGIPPAIQSQLFTPFFSTKKDGQGIGLTLIREILLNHGFRFGLESGVDGGTTFWIGF